MGRGCCEVHDMIGGSMEWKSNDCQSLCKASCNILYLTCSVARHGAWMITALKKTLLMIICQHRMLQYMVTRKIIIRAIIDAFAN